MMQRATIDVLVPTCNRPCALAVTLASLSAQTFSDFRTIMSDQSDGQASFDKTEVQAVMRQMQANGRDVLALRNLPRRGMAQQRAFLLSQVTAPYCLYLDDDVLLENDVLERMLRIIEEQQCGFVGSALHGMSFLDDIRPQQQHIEFWNGKVEPERVTPGSAEWARHHLHSAANLFHVQSRLGLTRATTRLYRIAWIGGCVLFDTEKLRSAGGFDFWEQLPEAHCGEDVLAQLRVMERYGGCGIIPSGAYHLELPTTVTTRDVDAPRVLPISSAVDMT
ncbi:glycosyltransferase family 2 protein [Noviherbaspirillum sp. ST9]|uniref:glycosyltransferase family 2 protein n=1 Tax=Noviherbaspirillum sp. ST9 TaxID=3401606 RepID=UPI003B588063